ncbi:hypothetical protein [Carboxylicivirga taeanensis]|uniref:hypothetical protein n=1 Tax=Carboxylicivirga taeanensis TaxID=1416875 RepID=UPI003F6DEF0A
MDKETFKENAKKSIDDIFDKIDELEAKKANTTAETKAAYNKKIAELKSKKDDLKIKYDELLNTTGANWDEAKKSFSESADLFKKGIQELTSLFHK